MRKPRRLHVVAIMGVYLAAGCTAWRPETTSPTSLFEEERPEQVRITLEDGTHLIIEDPRISGDSIVSGADDQQRQAAALADVAQLEVRRADGQQTAIIAVVAGALIFASYLACFGFVSPCGDGS